MTRVGGPVAGLVVASALWGGAVTGTKYALGGFDPYSLLMIELVSATTVLWGISLRRGFRAPRSVRLAVALGLLEPGSAYLAETLGLTHTSAAAGAIVSGLESAFVVVLAALFLKERITRPTAMAVLLAFAGLVVLEGRDPFHGAGLGDLYVAIGVLSASAYTVAVKRFPEEPDALALTLYQFSAGTMLALAVVGTRWLSGMAQPPTDVPLTYWVTAALVGIAGYAAPFLIFNGLIVRITAGAASVVLNLIPAFGVLSAMALLGETLSLTSASGLILVAAAVVAFVILETRPEPAPEAVPMLARVPTQALAAGPQSRSPASGEARPR